MLYQGFNSTIFFSVKFSLHIDGKLNFMDLQWFIFIILYLVTKCFITTGPIGGTQNISFFLLRSNSVQTKTKQKYHNGFQRQRL